MVFLSRTAAGRKLAAALRARAKDNPVLFALPRGGVIVAAETARLLRAPLDLILVRKIGHPASPEYAIGALSEGGKPVYNAAKAAALDDEWRLEAEKTARQVIAWRRQTYFPAAFPHPPVSGRIAIVIDDGMATGLTMLAAVSALRARRPKYIIAAVPAASRSSIDLLKSSVDECVVLDSPDTFRGAVGAHYISFPQVDDNEVKRYLAHLSTASRASRTPERKRAGNTAQ